MLAIERYAAAMGPADGPSEVLITRRRTTPLFAAMVNAAAAHVVEQDDVHNGSVFHPAAVVFPPALAVAQTLALGTRPADRRRGRLRGRHPRRRILGRSHYKIFHTTGTAGTIAAAVTVGRLLNLDAGQMLRAGSAGTQAAGLWEFLRDAADSKQLHTAKAAADGLTAAYLARDGFTGARHIPEGPRAWPRACRATPIRPSCATGWARAGRWPKPRSSTTPPAATRIRRPTRCNRRCASMD